MKVIKDGKTIIDTGGVVPNFEQPSRQVDVLLDCPTCNGKGTLKRYPYYATKMPDMIDMGCETCRGKGKIIVIDSPYEIYRKGAI